MALRILLIALSLVSLLKAADEDACYATNGALMDRQSLRTPLKSSCDLKDEACFAFVPDIDTMTIELGCAPKSALPANCFNKTFTCNPVSPFLHNDKTGFLCCCRSDECNNPSKIADLLPSPTSVLRETEQISYKWWHFPILVFCSFAVVLLFGVIASVLVILKNITKTIITNNAIDTQMYSRIHFQKAEQLRVNREIAIANVDVAVQELYHFLVHRRLVFVKNSDQKLKKKPPTQHVVIKMSLRTLDDLERRVSEQPHLQTPFPLSKNDAPREEF
uniref:Activin_recp domain-containing protein n=1 Tax=Panagrellus redivivus TaxID=6233 RepID=A0A7E4UXW1_PANRE